MKFLSVNRLVKLSQILVIITLKLKIITKTIRLICHLVQNPLSYLLISKKLEIKINKKYFYLLFCMGVKRGLIH